MDKKVKCADLMPLMNIPPQIESADSHINAADVLAEAQMMAAPQDLRYAVFYIGAAQKAPVALKADVAELRKSCIVQPNAQRKDGCFDITFSNGVTIQVSSHPCYSSVRIFIKISLNFLITCLNAMLL